MPLRDLFRRNRELKLPAHAIHVHWSFATPRMSTVEFSWTSHTDPGTDVGVYLAPYSGSIDGAEFYFGVQNDVYKPDVGSIGKGLIFSTWWSFDAGDTRIDTDGGGFIQLGTHEGTFVGVRRPYEWGAGDHTLRIARADEERGGDWFSLTCDDTWIGALRFPRRQRDAPAAIESGGTTFLEVYDTAERFEEIPDWWVDLQAYGDGERAVSARSEYPRFPHGQDIPNADCWYDSARDRVNLRFGGELSRMHAAQRFW